jgi:hypothetical protein
VKFIGPEGTRDFYRKAAELAGMKLNDWMRETLHKEASRLHAKHHIEHDAPAVHPEPPPPLQPGSR